MKRLIASLLLLSVPAFAGDEIVPDTTGILQLWGRHSFASGCPIAADRVLTNAHVLDIRPFDRDFPLIPYRYQGGGQEGQIVPRGTSSREDLAIGEPQPPLSIFYPLATEAPQPGDMLYWVGYERKNRKNALDRKQFKGKVLRVIAGQIILDEPTTRGSSGACLLNARGQVVGVVAWGLEMDNAEEVTVGVGVYGRWGEDVSRRSTDGQVEQGS